jgi:hypothetical protein
MKKYIVYLSSSIIVEAADKKGAENTALDIVSQIASEPNITSSDTEDILASLHVDDLTEEYGEEDEGTCMYDHDHTKGGCETHN